MPPAIPIQLTDAIPAAAVLAVVVTVTVAVALDVLLKSAVYWSTVSLVVTRQLAVGAVVAQENAVRPVPCVCVMFTVVVFPLVAPAFRLSAAG
jgi:hypothetical protein